MRTLIYGGHLIDPANRVDAHLNILIENGRVAFVTEDMPVSYTHLEYYDMWMAGVQTRTMPTQCIIKRISCVPLVHEQRSRHMPGALLIFQKGMDRL